MNHQSEEESDRDVPILNMKKRSSQGRTPGAAKKGKKKPNWKQRESMHLSSNRGDSKLEE